MQKVEGSNPFSRFSCQQGFSRQGISNLPSYLLRLGDTQAALTDIVHGGGLAGKNPAR
jgi:hypothetical protein